MALVCRIHWREVLGSLPKSQEPCYETLYVFSKPIRSVLVKQTLENWSRIGVIPFVVLEGLTRNI